MPKSELKLPVSEFVKQIVTDPAKHVDTLLLSGYVGPSSEKNSTRLYFDPQLSQYVEIPTKSILYSQPMAPEASPLGAVYVWIERNAELLHGKAGSERTKASFLEGPITQAAMAAPAQTMAITTIPGGCATHIYTPLPNCHCTPPCPTNTGATACVPCHTHTGATACAPCVTHTGVTACLPCHTQIGATACVPCVTHTGPTACLPCLTHTGPTVCLPCVTHTGQTACLPCQTQTAPTGCIPCVTFGGPHCPPGAAGVQPFAGVTQTPGGCATHIYTPLPNCHCTPPCPNTTVSTACPPCGVTHTGATACQPCISPHQPCIQPTLTCPVTHVCPVTPTCPVSPVCPSTPLCHTPDCPVTPLCPGTGLCPVTPLCHTPACPTTPLCPSGICPSALCPSAACGPGGGGGGVVQ